MGAAGRYSAGRIFLQVVPSFKNLQRDIDREVKKANASLEKTLGDGAEKSSRSTGEKAGKAYSDGFGKGSLGLADQVKASQREVEKDTSDHQKRVEAIFRKSLEDQLKARVTARAKAQAADDAARTATERAEQAASDRAAARAQKQADREAEIARRGREKLAADEQRHLERMTRIHERAGIENDRRDAERLRTRGGAARAELEKTIKSIERNFGDIDLNTPIGKELDRLKTRARQTSKDISKGLITTDEGVNNLRAMGRELRKLGRGGGVDVSTKGNIRGTIRDIDDLGRTIDRAGSRKGVLSGLLRGVTGDGQDGANAFRIFNYRILAVVTALPLLVPLLASAAGGIVALATAATGAGVGLGVLILGFSGIGAAVKAMGDVQNNTAKDTLSRAKTLRSAARGVRDAEQGLTRARQQAARSAEDSSRRIADAEQNLADAQKDATKAQNDLRLARRAAQQDQQDLADKIKSGQLDERQALIDLFNAQVAYNAAMADGGATNLEKEQASIDLERARLAIKGIREENANLAKESKKSNAQRVEEDSRVVSAKEGVVQAQQKVKDAEQGIVDARKQAAQQAVDNQISIRDATERVSDAQAAQQEALTKTGDVGSASMQKLDQAMQNLSPAGKRFATYLFSLRKEFYKLRNAAQEGMLPGVQTAIENIVGRYGPSFLKFVGTMATVLGALFVQASNTFTSPVWVDFFDMMAKMAPIFTQQFGDIFLNLLTGLAALMTAFAPMSKDFGAALVGMSAAFATWAAQLGDSKGFQDFVAYLEKSGPKVWKLIEAIAGAFVAIGVAMAPIADKLLSFAIDFFGYIADMDPKTLSGIVTGILGLVLASQLAAGATQMFISLSTPFHSMLALVVFGLVALGAGLLWAYNHNEKFREVMDKVISFISEHKGVFIVLAGIVTGLGGALFTVVKVMTFFFGPMRTLSLLLRAGGAAFTFMTGPIGLTILAIIAIGAALVWLWKNNETFRSIVTAAWDAIGKAAGWLWDNYIKPYFGFIWKILKDVGAVIWWFWTKVVGPVFQLVGAIAKALWDRYFSPALSAIGKAFGWLGDKISGVYKDHINPILDKFGLGADDLQRAWHTAIDLIGKAWDGLKAMVYKPIDFIVNTVINKGFVDNFNKLAKVFGTSEIPHLVLPSMTGDAKKAPATVNGKRANKGQFYTGGFTGYGAKYDAAGVVHKNEYVIKKESTNRIRAKYGLEVLDYMNTHGDLPGMGGYASGGLVNFGKKLQTMGFNVSENNAFGGVHPVHAKNSWHYRDGAIDVNYDGHGQAFETARINAIIGLAKQYGLRTIWQYPSHYDHAHFDVGTGPDLGNFSGASASNPGQGLPWYLDKPIDFMRKAINKITDTFHVDGLLGDFVSKVPLKVLDMAAAKIQDIISGGNGDMDSTGAQNNPTAGAEQWRSLAIAALGRVGQSSSLVDLVLSRMNQESSGDFKAINLWDSNAKAGHPSKGLMQVIDPTFAAFRDKSLPNDIYNPMSNLVASMRYTLATYGSLQAGYGRSGGYADGGLVGPEAGLTDNGTMMYDNGGYLPPGITQVVNLTGKPEPVFTADQFAGIRGGGGGSQPLIGKVDVTAQGHDLTARDVADEIIYAVTRVSHGGKFAGRTN